MGCLLLADTINKSGIPAATAVILHGDMAQEKRSEILREFLNNQHSVLVTTNILGRGVDLINVKQVGKETTNDPPPDFVSLGLHFRFAIFFVGFYSPGESCSNWEHPHFEGE